jgi:tetratricopeptide (TPR) repeat protein
MVQNSIYLLSVYLKKWSYGDNKITFNYTFCSNDHYVRKHKELRVNKVSNMISDLLGQVIKESSNQDQKKSRFIENEPEVKSKLNTFFSKIVHEFKHNKKSNGKSRMISSRSIDFYYSDADYEKIDDDVRFYVHLNRGLNKVSGDLWANAVTDFKLALKYRENDITVNKHLAIAYSKLGQFSDAVEPLKVYADYENSAESLNSLAMAYVHLEEYDKADEILKQIADNFDEKSIALFARAQIAYKKGKNYLEYLDEINKNDSAWLVSKLKVDWEYGLSNEEELTVWNAATAARYLGFERPFDLTKKAFNHEIPSYFDADKGTIRFIKEEIDCWINLHNRYHLDNSVYSVHEDKLTAEEISNYSNK